MFVSAAYFANFVECGEGLSVDLTYLVPPRRPGFDPGSGQCGIYGGQSGTEAGCLEILLFPLSTILQTASRSLLILSSTLCSIDIFSVVK
jgi:hypothetical protein